MDFLHNLDSAYQKMNTFTLKMFPVGLDFLVVKATATIAMQVFRNFVICKYLLKNLYQKQLKWNSWQNGSCNVCSYVIVI